MAGLGPSFFVMPACCILTHWGIVACLVPSVPAALSPARALEYC